MNETAETQAYQVVTAAKSALELAAEGLAMFEERRPDIVGELPPPSPVAQT